MKITRSPGGTEERTVDLDNIRIPDLWHIAEFIAAKSLPGLTGSIHSESILETWHLCHDLLAHLKAIQERIDLHQNSIADLEHGWPGNLPKESGHKRSCDAWPDDALRCTCGFIPVEEQTL